MITEHEMNLARHCISFAVAEGASGARVSLSKCVMDGCTMLNGSLDKVTHSADRSIYLYLFVDGAKVCFAADIHIRDLPLVEHLAQHIPVKRLPVVAVMAEDK